MLKVIKNFSSDTSLHGFIYIIQPPRHKTERIFWTLAIFASFIQTGILIYKFVVENQANPIVIYTDHNAISVQDINFPSVSFCPGILLKSMDEPFEYHDIKAQLENQTMDIGNLTMKELKMMQVASLVANDKFMSSNYQNLTIPTEDFVDILGSFGSFFGDPFGKLLFRPFLTGNWSDKYPANFTHTLWKTGFCYIFNFPNSSQMLHLDSTSSDFNYTNVTMLGTEYTRSINYNLTMSYPIKAQNPGKGLHLGYTEMQYSKHDVYSNFLNDAIPNKDYDGLKIWLNDAFEVLSDDSINLQIRQSSYSKILITPKIVKIDDSMMDFELDERQCYLKNERELKFLKVYNKINCEHECLANSTLQNCGCVQFYMVRDPATRICGIIDENCFRMIEDDFMNVKSSCMCYEPCETIKYEVKRIFDWTRKYGFSNFDGRNYNNIEVKIEFAVQNILATRKRKVFTFVDIFSLIGGFLGLFAGFSFLSAGEIILHFIIYPFITLKKSNSTKVRPFLEKKTQKPQNVVIVYILAYLEDSSIHSFKYFGDRKKKLVERLIWFIFFITSMMLAFLMVQRVFQKLKESEIYMSLEGKPTNVEDIPFPAFTIVPDIDDRYSFKYIPMFENNEKGHIRWKRVTDDFDYTLSDQVHAILCDIFFHVDNARDPFNFTSTSDLVDLLRNDSHQQRPWFKYRNAKWNGVVDPPFAEILTHYGFGYTFNLIDQTRLINEKTISKDFLYKYDGYDSTNFPWRARSGYNSGLDLTFRMNKLWQACFNFDTYIIHPPNELPINSQIVRHEDLATKDIFIIPEIVKTDEDLKHVDISLRKCYFDDERTLKYFKIYTQKNCEQECLPEIIYADCGCVPFYYIRNSSTTVCEYKRFNDCASKYERFSNFRKYENLFATQEICNCLPLCNYVSYSYEVVTRIYKRVQNTTIKLLWKDSEYYAQIRYQQFKIVDFLSYVGGILGLFAGISVLSIVEFFYYFTLRLATDFWRFLAN